MLTKARTVCGCQTRGFMMSASVTVLAHFIVAINFAFLLAGSAFGLPGPLRPPSWQAWLSWRRLADAISRTDSAAGLLLSSESVVILLAQACCVQMDHSASDKQQAEVRATRAE
jgi:hypothetical protein